MSDRLPPLTALRAFDAAARHMSFAKAAEELHVTPAALSFQIKSLEEHLGQPLFRRLNRAVELTEAGRTLAPGAAEGFTTLQTAWAATRRLQSSGTLTLTAGPALTAKWLAPRLFDFARLHPDIELRLSASLKVVDLRRDDVDAAIRFGISDDADLASYAARPDWVTPIMTPELHERFQTPESLRDAPLIFDDSLFKVAPGCDWPSWFRAVGMSYSPATGTHFSQPDHAIDAACAGLGVALGRRPLIIKDVSEGRLVAPFKVAVQTEARFRFICLPEAKDRPQIAAFREWFFAEIEKTAHMWDDFEIIPEKELGRP
ncbi:transcriptional regulator GcvA [Ruegeria conchae]|uniref:transcriptional regulator GcvA n=1 Tax=Ruegeria conchae TaxID=981384 RepID=UPI0021A4B7E6|nr:transcriptional regulator GcvA [Ruegeria conchae]UWR03377.1 transcriptional regulator GcvA [Ruegeria conchae]